MIVNIFTMEAPRRETEVEALNYCFNQNRAYAIAVGLECRRVLFFFQAEDGIRDHCVTGVQTCALPISPARSSPPTRTSASTCVRNATRSSPVTRSARTRRRTSSSARTDFAVRLFAAEDRKSVV